MKQNQESARILVLTVGTGNAGDLERSLITPMIKSIGEDEWKRIILLPSRITEESAFRLKNFIANNAVEILPLPEEGQENDADACFGYFDTVLANLLLGGTRPDQIVADFTRGTKAMSAALVLAAVHHDLSNLRYVYSNRRDTRGTVVAGTERIGEIKTSLVTARRRLDLAVALMRHGDFGAVTSVLTDSYDQMNLSWPSNMLDEARSLRDIARVYAAWDSLDYRAVFAALDDSGASRKALPFGFRPAEGLRYSLRTLSKEPKRSDMATYATWLRELACDLLVNAERRINDRHFEDALLRAYRILELVSQFRLFDGGYDSSCISPNDPNVKEFRKHLEKTRSRGFGLNNQTKTLHASRQTGVCFLKFLGDPFAKRLLKFDVRQGAVKTGNRNHSVLVHGFTAQAPSENKLRTVLEDLEQLLIDDDPAAADRLAHARRPFPLKEVAA